MKQEDKKLLLIDLCARLPYKVIIKSVGENKIIGLWDLRDIDNLPLPYLRPISSMTEEERKEYKKFDDFGASTLRKCEYQDFTVLIPSYDRLDWLLSHHFDFRYPGLISLGLALEAPEGMY